MKDKFYEFYKFPQGKVDEIWEKGLLVVDTNVLLDLYRLGDSSRKDLKKSIDFFGDRTQRRRTKSPNNEILKAVSERFGGLETST